MKTITLHVGAHRTGTTKIQKILDENETVLRRRGAFCLTPTRPGKRSVPTIRDAVSRAQRSVTDPTWRERMLSEIKARHRFLKAYISSGRHRHFVISDENSLGQIFDETSFDGIYPFAKPILQAMRRTIPSRVHRVCLAIRSYDTFLVSSYAMTAVYRGRLPAPNVAIPSGLILKRGWVDLIGDVRSVFPHAEIVLWKLENTAVERQISLLLGPTPSGGLSYVDSEMVNTAPTVEAIMEANTAPRGSGFDPDLLIQRYADGNRFDPLDIPTRDALRRQYEEDCATIERRYGLFSGS